MKQDEIWWNMENPRFVDRLKWKKHVRMISSSGCEFTRLGECWLCVECMLNVACSLLKGLGSGYRIMVQTCPPTRCESLPPEAHIFIFRRAPLDPCGNPFTKWLIQEEFWDGVEFFLAGSKLNPWPVSGFDLIFTERFFRLGAIEKFRKCHEGTILSLFSRVVCDSILAKDRTEMRKGRHPNN